MTRQNQIMIIVKRLAEIRGELLELRLDDIEDLLGDVQRMVRVQVEVKT